MSTAGSPTSIALEPNIRRPKAPRMTSVRCRASTSGGGPGQTVAIVGRGRVGLAIGRMCERLDMEHVFMTRGDTLFPPHGPIYVATHASDLDDVLALVPNDRRKDLVLLQGGLLRDDWLRHRGLNHSCAATQVALYMSAKGDGTVRDGGGATCACGPRAGDVSELLTKGGNVRCVVVDEAAFRVASVCKLVWTSAFWLLCRSLCTTPGDAMTVGEVVDSSEGERAVRELACELLDCVEAAGELRVGDENENENGNGDSPRDSSREAVLRGIFEYSRSIPSSVPSAEMALKEAGFRNGWFLARRSAESPQTRHADHLRRIGLDPDALV